MTYTTNVAPGHYDTIQEAAEAIETLGLGQGGTIYDETGKPVAQYGPDGLIEY
ncbi:MAG TPA: hypothetical protein VNN73_17390 [Blastocatellia bacterium]|nr:hypothetical protein [Blastocatellia bacterium]